ncbi:MAG: hypothetical protein PHV20_14510 [Bacteroidales bacterium]|nr:hypothetical protein [Bacteroidales bacterium]
MTTAIKSILHFILTLVVNLAVIYLTFLGLNSLTFLLMFGILENQIVASFTTILTVSLTCIISIKLLNFLKEKAELDPENYKRKNYEKIKKLNIILSISFMLITWLILLC